MTFSLKEQIVILIHGAIRGVVCFGLAVAIHTPNTANLEVLVSSSFVLVFVTTFVFSIILQMIVKHMETEDETINYSLIEDNNFEEFDFQHPNNKESFK